MSVREEDRQKNSCPSRGLGIAAAAIGVGVGAALYYFFNKRQETPNSEGSTSDWQCEQPQTLGVGPTLVTARRYWLSPSARYAAIVGHVWRTNSVINDSADSHITISEHETTDTSINRTENSDQSEDSEESDHSEQSDLSEISDSSGLSDLVESSDSSSDGSETSGSEMNDVFMDHSTMQSDNTAASVLDSDTELGWDVTNSSVGVPEDTSQSSIASLLGRIDGIIKRRKKMTEEDQMAILRQEAFRERSWSLEECSICFDVMLRNQELTSLPCTHNFHTDCIMPWLQEKQTCPNCRKVA